jgi:putative addiction module CopG family antidote
MATDVIMNVALTDHWENFIRHLIGTGRYNNASEVVRAALRELREKEGEVFPPGSLKPLYDTAHNRAETKLARRLRVPRPNEV